MDAPLSEQYAVAAARWVDLEAAAQILEDTKSSVMAQRQMACGDVPVNRAEQMVKASRDWVDHLEKIAEARREANLAKVNLEVIRMKFQEWNNDQANHRMEMKL